MKNFDTDFIQYSDKKVKEETKNLALYLTLHISLYILLIFFIIFFAWYTYFTTTHSFYEVKGASMKNTLNVEVSDTDGRTAYDAVYVNTTDRGQLFDVVVIKKPTDTDAIIKRTMALGGDFITIAQDESGNFRFYRIAKNEMILQEGKYTTEKTDEQAKLIEEGQNGYSIRGYDDWTANRDAQLKVLNSAVINYEEDFYKKFLQAYFDNPESQELKYNYYVSENELVYVQVPQNFIFYMGDNRGHSDDSRLKGFCSVDYIVGKVDLVVYNYNFGNRLLEFIKYYFYQFEEFFAR
ncbi:MAG: S26 family signal peptidase [Clostridia bacterium]|nr:S26 family signal peptidase [Clostridia bacterium]